MTVTKTKKTGMPRCPVCGAETRSVYEDDWGSLVGCPECVHFVDAYDLDECYYKTGGRRQAPDGTDYIPHCPNCGEETDTVIKDYVYDIIGCPECIEGKNAYDYDECFLSTTLFTKE